MRALAAALAGVAVLCMIGAVAGMISGRETPRTGWLLRLGALVCFGAAVALNAAAH